jgi:predicted 3-demethylubiquinone-9 3-methyltransferase (glyoxalase superfamily)
MQKIIPSLWFDKECEEALNFYTSLFKNSKIVSIKRYPENNLPDFMKGMEGKIITAIFELEGQRFMALDGGPAFKPNEAVSLYVECKDQEEVDYFWNAFIKHGGEESQCGWLKDKYGFSWQIAPTILGKLLSDPDKEKADRAMHAMLKMKKIIIADLEKAFNGQ